MASPQKTRSFSASVTRTGTGRHPSWEDLKTVALREVKEKLADVAAKRPGTGYVDYNGIIREVANYGNLYDNAGEDQIVWRDDGSDTHHGDWKGWITVDLKVPFDETILTNVSYMVF